MPERRRGIPFIPRKESKKTLAGQNPSLETGSEHRKLDRPNFALYRRETMAEVRTLLEGTSPIVFDLSGTLHMGGATFGEVTDTLLTLKDRGYANIIWSLGSAGGVRRFAKSLPQGTIDLAIGDDNMRGHEFEEIVESTPWLTKKQQENLLYFKDSLSYLKTPLLFAPRGLIVDDEVDKYTLLGKSRKYPVIDASEHPVRPDLIPVIESKYPVR